MVRQAAGSYNLEHALKFSIADVSQVYNKLKQALAHMQTGDIDMNIITARQGPPILRLSAMLLLRHGADMKRSHCQWQMKRWSCRVKAISLCGRTQTSVINAV